MDRAGHGPELTASRGCTPQRGQTPPTFNPALITSKGSLSLHQTRLTPSAQPGIEHGAEAAPDQGAQGTQQDGKAPQVQQAWKSKPEMSSSIVVNKS